MLLRKVPLFVKVLSGTVGLTGVTVGTLYVTRPDLIVGELMRWQRLRVGLRRKYAVLGDGFRMCYAERGSPQPGIPTVVMLHGYSSSLDAAVSVVKRLPPHMHVIAVDAPGHGKTKQVGDYDLRPKVMAQRLNQFIKKKHLDEEGLHLVGWAMGGTIAGFYAAQYPDDLKLLTLAAPGIYTRIMTKAIKETVDGDTHVLLPVTEEEQKRFWQIVMYKNNVLPKPLRDHFQRMKLKRKQDLLKVMKTMIEDVMGKEDNMFIKHIQRIRTPTQIIWGDKDLVQHISGLDLLMSTVGHWVKRKDVIKNCGHAFYAEEPNTLANLIVAFQADYRLYGKEWGTENLDEGLKIINQNGKGTSQETPSSQ